MILKKTVVSLIAVSILATGCASMPRGSDYVPLVDMQGKDEAAFRKDVGECQNYARQRMNAADGAVAGAVAGALLGAFLAPRGSKNYLAGKGAGLGAVSGAAGATENQETITKRCLAGRGYNVLN